MRRNLIVDHQCLDDAQATNNNMNVGCMESTNRIKIIVKKKQQFIKRS